jgi:YHS domain-containing protein
MKPTLLLTVLAFGLASCSATQPPRPDVDIERTVANRVPKPKPKPYPLKTCLVTGDGLDDMDERVSLVYEGQTFEFCCKPCVKKFNKNPGKYVRALEKATKG